MSMSVKARTGLLTGAVLITGVAGGMGVASLTGTANAASRSAVAAPSASYATGYANGEAAEAKSLVKQLIRKGDDFTIIDPCMIPKNLLGPSPVTAVGSGSGHGSGNASASASGNGSGSISITNNNTATGGAGGNATSVSKGGNANSSSTSTSGSSSSSSSTSSSSSSSSSGSTTTTPPTTTTTTPTTTTTTTDHCGCDSAGISFQTPIYTTNSSKSFIVDVNGTGFHPNSAVSFGYGTSVSNSTVTMINAKSNSSGNWSGTFTSPWSTGSYEMYAQDAQGALADASIVVTTPSS